MGCENASTSKNHADFPCISLQNQDASNQSLNPSKEQPSHTSQSAGSSSAAADQDAEVKAAAEKTLEEMRTFRPDLCAVKAALNKATSSNYTTLIKSLQSGINFEIFAIDNLIGSLSKQLQEQNWAVLGQQLEGYQRHLQQAKDKVSDAQSALAAAKCNNTAKVSFSATATYCNSLTAANCIACLLIAEVAHHEENVEPDLLCLYCRCKSLTIPAARPLRSRQAKSSAHATAPSNHRAVHMPLLSPQHSNLVYQD